MNSSNHEPLQPLPASEFERVAALLRKDYDAIIGLRRCSCGGMWRWLADGRGFIHLEHQAADA